MFAYINGILEEKATTYVVIDVVGIGYKIFMSGTSIDKIGEIGEKVKVHTHYHVREDNISLYGFLGHDELRMFELLLQVSGIGAKSAISILSEISPSSFAFAVITNDISKLIKIPGIGRKTAERTILELKDKLKTDTAIEKDEKATKVIEEDDKSLEVISALQVLGYNKKEIEKVLEKVDIKELSVEDSIRKLLGMMGK